MYIFSGKNEDLVAMRYIPLIEMSKQVQDWVTDTLNKFGLDPNHYADKFIGVMEKNLPQLEEYLDSCLALKYSGNCHREKLARDGDHMRKEILLAYLNPNNVKDLAEMEKDEKFVAEFMNEYTRIKLTVQKDEPPQISAPVRCEEDIVMERYEEVFPKLLPGDDIIYPKNNLEWPIEKSKGLKKDESHPIPRVTGSNHSIERSMENDQYESNYWYIYRSISVASPELNEFCLVRRHFEPPRPDPGLIVYKDYKDSPAWIDDSIIDSEKQIVKDENGNVPKISVQCVTPTSKGDKDEMTPPKNNIDSIGPSGLEKPKRSSTPSTSPKSVQSSQDQYDIHNVDRRVDDPDCPWFPVDSKRSIELTKFHPDPKKRVYRKSTFTPKEPSVGATSVRELMRDSMHRCSVEPGGSRSELENSVYELLDSSPEGCSSDVKVSNALISDERPCNSLVLPNGSSQNLVEKGVSSTIPRCEDYPRGYYRYYFIPDFSGLFGLHDLNDRLSVPQSPVHNEISFFSNTSELNLSKHDLLNGSSQKCLAASEKLGDDQNNLQNDLGILCLQDFIDCSSVPQSAGQNEISFLSNTSDSKLSIRELLNGSSQNCSVERDYQNRLQINLGIYLNPATDWDLPNFEGSNHNLHIELQSNTQPYSVSSTDLKFSTLATNFQNGGPSPTVYFPSSAEYRAKQNTRLELGQSNILLNSFRLSGNWGCNNSNPETSENIDIAGNCHIPCQQEFDLISTQDMINWTAINFGHSGGENSKDFLQQQIRSDQIQTNHRAIERLMKEFVAYDESQKVVGFGKSQPLNTPTDRAEPPDIDLGGSCFNCFCCRDMKLCDIKEICEESCDESDLSGGSSGYDAGSSESNDDSCEFPLPSENLDRNEYPRSNDDMDNFVLAMVSEYLDVSSEPEVPSYFASGAHPSVNDRETNSLYLFNLSATRTMDEMGSSKNMPSWQTQVPFQNTTFQSELPFFNNEHMVVGNASPVRTGIQVPVMQVCPDNLVKLFPEKFFKPIPPEIQVSADISSEDFKNQTIVDRTQYNSEKFTQTVPLSGKDRVEDVQGDFGLRLEKIIKSLVSEESDEVEDVDDAAGDGTVFLIHEPTPWETTESIYRTPFCLHEANICEPRMEQKQNTGSNDPKQIVLASGDGCMPRSEAVGCIPDAQDHFATVQSSLGVQEIHSCIQSSIGNGQQECTIEQTVKDEPNSVLQQGVNEQEQQQSPPLLSDPECPYLLSHNRTPQLFQFLIEPHRFEGNRLTDSNALENQSKFMKLFGY